MKKAQPEPPENFLEKRLKAPGKKAFVKLCELGCDKQILGGLLLLLAPKKKRLFLNGDRGICVHALDTLDDALKGIREKLGSKKDIRALQRTSQRAKRLREEIKELKGTAFMGWLKETGYIGDDDLLGGSTIPELVDCQFEGLLNLPELAKQVGSRKRPDCERLLTNIYVHIHERTGGWQDQLLHEILYDLLPNEPGTRPLDLPSWRQRHGLTDSK